MKSLNTKINSKIQTCVLPQSELLIALRSKDKLNFEQTLVLRDKHLSNLKNIKTGNFEQNQHSFSKNKKKSDFLNKVDI